MEAVDEGLDSMILEGEHDEDDLREYWARTLRALPLDSVPYFGLFYDPNLNDLYSHAHTLDVLPYVSPLLEFIIEGVKRSTKHGTGVIDVEWANLYRDNYLRNPDARYPFKTPPPIATADFTKVVDTLTEKCKGMHWLFLYQDGTALKVRGNMRVSGDYPIVAFLFYTLSGHANDNMILTLMLGAAVNEFKDPPDAYDKLRLFFTSWMK